MSKRNIKVFDNLHLLSNFFRFLQILQ